MGRIKGRPSKYLKSLKADDEWEIVKRKVKIRDQHKCKICGIGSGLEVHHITYYIAGQSIRGKELQNLKWLVTVCNKHHKEIHQDLNHPFNPKNKNKRNAETY
ncbi:HNH endonuclease [Elizabethkingia anophelis]|nr:HNH endonuclease [Elizabethkingia anophelis]MDV3952123.1 HNH endonuclease [Elizabethkingia anophelis]